MKTNTLNLDGFGKKLQDMEEHLQNKVVNQMMILFSTAVCNLCTCTLLRVKLHLQQLTIEELQRQLHYAKVCHEDEIKVCKHKLYLV